MTIHDIRDHLYEDITPDRDLIYDIWEPDSPVVVLGSSQSAEREARIDRCDRDGVPILKRRGGGGAVLLVPGVVCLSIAFHSTISDSPLYFFRQINAFIIRVLEASFDVQDLGQRGISDIAIGDKKILGCSMFKSRSTYFYQGSLLVDVPLTRLSTYLKHPSKEPDYRQGRSHRDFMTSLVQSGVPVTSPQMITAFARTMKHSFRQRVLSESVSA
jgi:lipoate-protein ligase A